MTALIVMLIFVLALTLFLLGMAISYMRTGVPTVSSASAAHAQIAEVLRKEGVKKIYELGAGKGNFAFALAERLPNAQVVGYELSMLPFLYARIWRLVHPAGSRVNFILKNFASADISDADAVVFYLMPHANKKLEPKLLSELRDGAIVATVSFAMTNWQPLHILKAENFSKTRSYVYRMPPRKATQDDAR